MSASQLHEPDMVLVRGSPLSAPLVPSAIAVADDAIVTCIGGSIFHCATSTLSGSEAASFSRNLVPNLPPAVLIHSCSAVSSPSSAPTSGSNCAGSTCSFACVDVTRDGGYVAAGTQVATTNGGPSSRACAPSGGIHLLALTFESVDQDQELGYATPFPQQQDRQAFHDATASGSGRHRCTRKSISRVEASTVTPGLSSVVTATGACKRAGNYAAAAADTGGRANVSSPTGTGAGGGVALSWRHGVHALKFLSRASKLEDLQLVASEAPAPPSASSSSSSHASFSYQQLQPLHIVIYSVPKCEQIACFTAPSFGVHLVRGSASNGGFLSYAPSPGCVYYWKKAVAASPTSCASVSPGSSAGTPQSSASREPSSLVYPEMLYSLGVGGGPGGGATSTTSATPEKANPNVDERTTIVAVVSNQRGKTSERVFCLTRQGLLLSCAVVTGKVERYTWMKHQPGQEKEQRNKISPFAKGTAKPNSATATPKNLVAGNANSTPKCSSGLGVGSFAPVLERHGKSLGNNDQGGMWMTNGVIKKATSSTPSTTSSPLHYTALEYLPSVGLLALANAGKSKVKLLCEKTLEWRHTVSLATHPFVQHPQFLPAGIQRILFQDNASRLLFVDAAAGISTFDVNAQHVAKPATPSSLAKNFCAIAPATTTSGKGKPPTPTSRTRPGGGFRGGKGTPPLPPVTPSSTASSPSGACILALGPGGGGSTSAAVDSTTTNKQLGAVTPLLLPQPEPIGMSAVVAGYAHGMHMVDMPLFAGASSGAAVPAEEPSPASFSSRRNLYGLPTVAAASSSSSASAGSKRKLSAEISTPTTGARPATSFIAFAIDEEANVAAVVEASGSIALFALDDGCALRGQPLSVPVVPGSGGMLSSSSARVILPAGEKLVCPKNKASAFAPPPRSGVKTTSSATPSSSTLKANCRGHQTAPPILHVRTFGEATLLGCTSSGVGSGGRSADTNSVHLWKILADERRPYCYGAEKLGQFGIDDDLLTGFVLAGAESFWVCGDRHLLQVCYNKSLAENRSLRSRTSSGTIPDHNLSGSRAGAGLSIGNQSWEVKKREIAPKGTRWAGLAMSADTNAAIVHAERRVCVYDGTSGAAVCHANFDRKQVGGQKFTSKVFGGSSCAEGELYVTANAEETVLLVFRVSVAEKLVRLAHRLSVAGVVSSSSLRGLCLTEDRSALLQLTSGAVLEVFFGNVICSDSSAQAHHASQALIRDRASDSVSASLPFQDHEHNFHDEHELATPTLLADSNCHRSLVPTPTSEDPKHQLTLTQQTAFSSYSACSPIAFESGLLPKWAKVQGSERRSKSGRKSLGRNWGRQTLVGKPVLGSEDLANPLTLTGSSSTCAVLDTTSRASPSHHGPPANAGAHCAPQTLFEQPLLQSSSTTRVGNNQKSNPRSVVDLVGGGASCAPVAASGSVFRPPSKGRAAGASLISKSGSSAASANTKSSTSGTRSQGPSPTASATRTKRNLYTTSAGGSHMHQQKPLAVSSAAAISSSSTSAPSSKTSSAVTSKESATREELRVLKPKMNDRRVNAGAVAAATGTATPTLTPTCCEESFQSQPVKILDFDENGGAASEQSLSCSGVETPILGTGEEERVFDSEPRPRAMGSKSEMTANEVSRTSPMVSSTGGTGVPGGARSGAAATGHLSSSASARARARGGSTRRSSMSDQTRESIGSDRQAGVGATTFASTTGGSGGGSASNKSTPTVAASNSHTLLSRSPKLRANPFLTKPQPSSGQKRGTAILHNSEPAAPAPVAGAGASPGEDNSPSVGAESSSSVMSGVSGLPSTSTNDGMGGTSQQPPALARSLPTSKHNKLAPTEPAMNNDLDDTLALSPSPDKGATREDTTARPPEQEFSASVSSPSLDTAGHANMNAFHILKLKDAAHVLRGIDVQDMLQDGGGKDKAVVDGLLNVMKEADRIRYAIRGEKILMARAAAAGEKDLAKDGVPEMGHRPERGASTAHEVEELRIEEPMTFSDSDGNMLYQTAKDELEGL